MTTLAAMETDYFLDHGDDSSGHEDEIMSDSGQSDQPAKVRKKPGRKPNPASPALRKAQNRAAQRAFRERKERYLREMETTAKQAREENTRLQTENTQFKSENAILKSENWYLKGIVLSLHLVCYQHGLVLPKHDPHINDQILTELTPSIPNQVAVYKDCVAKSTPPPTVNSHGNTASHVTSEEHVVSTVPLRVTEDGIQPLTATGLYQPLWESESPLQCEPEGEDTAMHPLAVHTPSKPPCETPLVDNTSPLADDIPSAPHPVLRKDEDMTSNLTAIQILRLRLRLQAACARQKSGSFTLEPTFLQKTIPHDPRIDMIPTPHMRDRMILFRDQFDLDDCCRCLLIGNVFQGGDPTVAGNWDLPEEFFDKYWFLTSDYSLHRTNKRLRKSKAFLDMDTTDIHLHTASLLPLKPRLSFELAPASDPHRSLPSLEVTFDTLMAEKTPPSHQDIDHLTSDFCSPTSPCATSITSSDSGSSPHYVPESVMNDRDSLFSFAPIQLTNGYKPMTVSQSHTEHPTP